MLWFNYYASVVSGLFSQNCTVDPRLSEQQWPEDSKNHADK